MSKRRRASRAAAFGLAMKVQIVNRKWRDDRVLSRFARHLAEHLGWGLGKKPDRRADVNYWLAFYERGRFESFSTTAQAAYITHLDESEAEPRNYRLYFETAALVDLRVCMNRADRERLEAEFGPTVAPPLPVELDQFSLRREPPGDRPVIGFSGFVYRSGRKGGDLAKRLIETFGDRCSFMASGRKWPCPTKLYPWREVPDFFRRLDLYVSTAVIEGGPMTTLEALACGIPVVIGAGVGIHDELPDAPGIHRYRAGDADDLVRAVDEALSGLARIDRAELRRAVEPHSVAAWCEGHERAFAAAF